MKRRPKHPHANPFDFPHDAVSYPHYFTYTGSSTGMGQDIGTGWGLGSRTKSGAGERYGNGIGKGDSRGDADHNGTSFYDNLDFGFDENTNGSCLACGALGRGTREGRGNGKPRHLD